jgi:Flp pilus assembly protein TadD
VAFQKDNTNASAINNLAKFYHNSGNVQLARQYEQATEQFNNRNPYFHFARGNFAYNNNNLNAARTSYRKAISLDALEPDFYKALGQVYSELGEVVRAKRMAESAQKILAQNTNIYQPSSQKVRIIDSGTILRPSSPGLSIILDGSRGVDSRR